MKRFKYSSYLYFPNFLSKYSWYLIVLGFSKTIPILEAAFSAMRVKI